MGVGKKIALYSTSFSHRKLRQRFVARFIFSLLLFFFAVQDIHAQHYLERLEKKYDAVKSNDDTAKVLAMVALATYFEYAQSDSGLLYARNAAALAEKLDYEYGRMFARRSIFYIINLRGNYPKALEIALQNLQMAEQFSTNKPAYLAIAHHDVALVKREMKDLPNAMSELWHSINLQKESGNVVPDIFGAYTQLAVVYLRSGNSDSALYYARHGYELAQLMVIRKAYEGLATTVLGNVYESMGKVDSAMKYYRIAEMQSRPYDNNYIIARISNNLATLYNKLGKRDSCIYYAQRSLAICEKYNFGEYASDAGGILSSVYEKERQPDSALKYIKIMLAAKDTIFSQAKMQQMQLLVFDEEQRQKEIDAAREKYRNEVRVYALLFIILVFILLSVILYRNNLQRKRTNNQLQKQKDELQSTLEELRSTQAKLIHSEKMASLGELTAGIAHEIQNPLNFVNNFSDVNEELIDEMKDAMKSGNTSEALEIADNIKENLNKISHHGQRADAIVKGMLQHSRVGNGRKEPTDINALADEYLRLSYHGMRTRDKSFNATIRTNFDTRLTKLILDPQSIGRVLLNLINNALYSLNEKRKKSGEDYEPILTVSTRRIPPGSEGWPTLEIKISDNGIGVAGPILGKIFQPFFTTKGPGQGTGLGLSLAYDIVNKEHGGQIDVDTHEGEYAEFIIRIPLKENLK